MLRANPTERGTGIAIYGDYNDLSLLYDLIHHMTDVLDEFNEKQKGQYQLLMNFSYEIRKAMERSRLIEKVEIKNEAITYLGAQFVWIDILLYTNVLRDNAGFLCLNKLEQSVLYSLEFVVEEMLMEYDAEGGDKLKNLVGNGLHVNQKYIFLIYQVLHANFVAMTVGKERFRKLCDLILDYFTQGSSTQEKLIKHFEELANQYACDILDLEIDGQEEIIW